MTILLPSSEVFRAWLARSLSDLDIAPATLSRRAGLSVNLVSRILAGNDLTLGTAFALERELRGIALVRGIGLSDFAETGPSTEEGLADA